MRTIDTIIVHCTAGPATDTARKICDYHTRPASAGGRGWKTPGYHYIIEADGSTVPCVPVSRISNGCRGHNATAINIAYTGGVDPKDLRTPRDTRTPEQREALLNLLTTLRRQFPDAQIHGHRDFANKACPSFDARKEYKSL